MIQKSFRKAKGCSLRISVHSAKESVRKGGSKLFLLNYSTFSSAYALSAAAKVGISPLHLFFSPQQRTTIENFYNPMDSLENQNYIAQSLKQDPVLNLHTEVDERMKSQQTDSTLRITKDGIIAMDNRKPLKNGTGQNFIFKAKGSSSLAQHLSQVPRTVHQASLKAKGAGSVDQHAFQDQAIKQEASLKSNVSETSAESRCESNSTPGRKKSPEIDTSTPGFYELPLAERSKLIRAKRNREAAHRSRAKNKARQELLEEETHKQLQLNNELSSLLSFILKRIIPKSAESQHGNTSQKKAEDS